MGFNTANNANTDTANNANTDTDENNTATNTDTDAKQRQMLDIRDNLCYNVFVGGRSA
jgi:hypothetical protein